MINKSKSGGVDLTFGFARKLQELGLLSISITSHGEQLSSHTIPVTSPAAASGGGGDQGFA